VWSVSDAQDVYDDLVVNSSGRGGTRPHSRLMACLLSRLRTGGIRESTHHNPGKLPAT
jgi:hypothetical protein